MGVHLHRGPIGGPRRSHCFTWDFETKARFLFIRRPCLLGNLRAMFKNKKDLEMDNSLHSSPVGNLEEGLLTRDFERQ
jgi:hypothetical protein